MGVNETENRCILGLFLVLVWKKHDFVMREIKRDIWMDGYGCTEKENNAQLFLFYNIVSFLVRMESRERPPGTMPGAPPAPTWEDRLPAPFGIGDDAESVPLEEDDRSLCLSDDACTVAEVVAGGKLDDSFVGAVDPPVGMKKRLLCVMYFANSLAFFHLC
jgi:hypothetical protein